MATLFFILSLIVGWLFLSTGRDLIFSYRQVVRHFYHSAKKHSRVEWQINFSNITTARVNQPAYAAIFTGTVSPAAQSRGLL